MCRLDKEMALSDAARVAADADGSARYEAGHADGSARDGVSE